MNIRCATVADAPGACLVLRRSITELCELDHGGDEKLLAKWLSNKTVENVHRWILQAHFLVAEEDGRILGCAAMTGSGKVTLNYVAPEARFRGVSKGLLLQLEARARALGLGECVLESTQTALRFYYSLGYLQSPDNYVLPLTGTPATVLRKSLQSPNPADQDGCQRQR